MAYPYVWKNIRITVYLPRHIGGSLQQKVIVTVHTSYQATSEFRGIERIHQHHFLALCQRSGGRKHHLEITLLILDSAGRVRQKAMFVIAFHIRHNTPAPFL